MNTLQEFRVSFSVSIVFREGSIEGLVVAECLRWLEMHQEGISPRSKTAWNCFVNCFVEKFDGYFQIPAWEKVVISRRHQDLHTSIQLLESDLSGLAIEEIRFLLSSRLKAQYERMLDRADLKVREYDWKEPRSLMRILMADLAESNKFSISEETTQKFAGLVISDCYEQTAILKNPLPNRD